MSTHSEEPPARTKLQAQVEHLVTELRRSEPTKSVTVAPESWRDDDNVHYLHQDRVILVRDEDVERVRRVVPSSPADNLFNGLTLLEIERNDVSVADALRQTDQQIGFGVATPNHVLSITGIFCPATEPEETAATVPDPPIREAEGGGRDVLVSVVDTGFISAAADTYGWLAGVKGDADDPIDPATGLIKPYGAHGTFVAGVLRSMVPSAEVYVEGVLNRAGAVLESDIVAQLHEALDRSPDVICLCAGTATRHGLPLLGFETFWEQRLRHYKGVQLVAAAGNDGLRYPFWPAAFPWAVSVGALAEDGRSRASFSNYGGWVDVYAPGEGLVNAFTTGDFVCHEPPHAGTRRHFTGLARWSGTSFSTPLVAGLIAERMSRTGENGRQAAEALLATARNQALPGVGAVLLPTDRGL